MREQPSKDGAASGRVRWWQGNRQMRNEAEPDIKRATAVVSTTHRAKGLEFRQVRVPDDDFAILMDGQGRLRAMTTPEQIEEVNLYYVAMTRATHHFRPNSELIAALLEIPIALREADTTLATSLTLKRIAISAGH